MKARVNKQRLLEHRKLLAAAKPKSGKWAGASEIVLSVSDGLTITGFGMKHDIPCESLQWGTTSLPYTTWSELMKIISQPLFRETITIETGSGFILFDAIKVQHPRITVAPSNKLVYEVPIDASDRQILDFILRAPSIEQMRNSGLWGTYQAILEKASSDIIRAQSLLNDYGVGVQALANDVVDALEVKDRALFLDHLKERIQKKSKNQKRLNAR